MSNLKKMLQKAAAGKNADFAAPPDRGGKKNTSGSTGIFDRLAQLYAGMEEAYRTCAEAAGLSCKDCGNNCCTSFFQHHTYLEWAYLWRGLQGLPDKQRKHFIRKAREYVDQAKQSMASGLLPSAMCPLNEDGLCALYSHRLMICRLHGTRNVFLLPDGRQQVFPGCWRFTELPCAREGHEDACPSLDRTPFYRELAALEIEFLKKAKGPMPRVDMTLAEMVALGPPRLR